ncbi:hypothetical protein N8I74_14505 [Chitiniphilus purpureus]|uniref:Uncharacterized protein n=1 Tax=Chitiniphilus purpureus TaxID=2981137 RepID=A0ABY6DJI3_9NEIS|nr:hypothetical protein [Chitiniphilus sp. CD1]UXY14520.1 hypothetical protein N8I74_14505 [Chitiniphilus sp. CD1]
MVMTKNLLKLAEMEVIAKKAMFEALRDYPKPSEGLENLTLGSGITDSAGIFELYLAGERPQDARVLSRATVDRSSGEVHVEVFLDKPLFSASS